MSRDSFAVEEQKTLQHLSDMLHLFHHRNKNQHRHSLWWRHFSVFRRQLNYLVKDIAQLNSIPDTHVARTKKKIRDPQLRARVQERLSFWQGTLVPKWQRAFSQTTADKRFAVLGLVLLAVLAEICATTGLTAVFEDLAQVEVERVLERFAREEWKQDAGVTEQSSGMEDVGEAIERDDADGMVATTAVQHPELVIASDRETSVATPLPEARPVPSKPLEPSAPKNAQRTSTSKPSAKKKKRRKGDNAIDDLFAGF